MVAPFFYFVLAGLPGALAYRFLNTADAMLGYRGPTREWLGKAPARADDAANLIPARLAAALLVLAAACLGEDARGAFGIWRQDAGKTASPNAGHPMSAMAAMAGALGVELEKAGPYKLGEGLALSGPSDIGRGCPAVLRPLSDGPLDPDCLGGSYLTRTESDGYTRKGWRCTPLALSTKPDQLHVSGRRHPKRGTAPDARAAPTWGQGGRPARRRAPGCPRGRHLCPRCRTPCRGPRKSGSRVDQP